MKIIYLIVFSLFIIASSQAQLIKSYGLKIGATISNQEWDYSTLPVDFDPDSRWGINFGAYVEFLNIPYFSVVTELNYVQKGMKGEGPFTTTQNPDGSGEVVAGDTRIDYLDLSALGKLRINFGIISPYLVIGPKIDYEINQQNSIGLTNVFEEYFNEVMYGFKIGIGSEIKFDSVSLLAEIMYDFNINHLYEGEYLSVNSDSFDFRIGVMF